LPEAGFFESRRHGGVPSLGLIALFGLGGRDIPDRLETGEQANAMRSREPATGVEPIDPLEIVSQVQERRASERFERDQVATAGSLTLGVSVTRARVSSDM
jgi:hypothetical protein